MLIMRFKLALISVLMLVIGVSAQSRITLPKLAVEEYNLPNGLRVILHQDTSAPTVTVNIWYHVGSKNEVVGKTGFAHLFEHLMFQGSKNYPTDYFKPIQEAGGSLNGQTNYDVTRYYETVPSNFLELALFMEADRMSGLLDAMTQDKLDNQRDVVKNERRQNFDNRPYGTALEKIHEAMFPAGHPYHWRPIGSLEDLTAASQEDVKAFFRKNYVPNNASLVIAGDFNPQQAKAWVRKYFGPIPKGANVNQPQPAPARLNGETRNTFEDTIQLPRVYVVWHTSPAYSADEAALDILASILSNGRGSRFQRNLVFGKQLAQSVAASNFAYEIAGLFVTVATARPGKPIEENEKELNAEIERMKNEPPSGEEVRRAINSIESEIVFSMESNLAKAQLLNNYATYLGRPNSFQYDLDRYERVTPEDVQRVAKKYLNGDKFVMRFVPRKSEATSSENSVANKPTTKPNSSEGAKDYSANLPKPRPNPKLTLPAIEKEKLSNGLNVWLVRRPNLPIVSLNMVVNAGATADPKDRAGLVSFTAALVNSGTKTRSAVEIDNRFQSLGVSFRSSSGWDSATLSVDTLTKNLDQALEVYADLIVHPTFPAEELETRRKRTLASLMQQKNDANAIADAVFNKLIYGADHPYGKTTGGDEASVKAITRDEIEKFYSTYYRPNNATLIVVGDVDAKMLLAKLESAFKDWKSGDSVTVESPIAPIFDKPGIYLVDKPGAPQSVIVIGQVGVPRTSPDYFPLQVMNSILGGQFVSRLNMNLREDKGYTYGASSVFSYRRGAGPFQASAGVQTAVTKESVVEFMKELNGIRGAIPVTQKELDSNKQAIIRRYPGAFATVSSISNQLTTLALYGLPDSHFSDYIQSVQTVTLEDVLRVSNKYLKPDQMAILIVGDQKVIEPKLRKLNLPITILDRDGNTVR